MNVLRINVFSVPAILMIFRTFHLYFSNLYDFSLALEIEAGMHYMITQS